MRSVGRGAQRMGLPGMTAVGAHKDSQWPPDAVPIQEVIQKGVTRVAIDVFGMFHEHDGRGLSMLEYVPIPSDLRPSHAHTLLIHPQGTVQAREARAREDNACGEVDASEGAVRGSGWSHARGQGGVCASLKPLSNKKAFLQLIAHRQRCLTYGAGVQGRR